ncbi:MAG: allantoicase [Acidobacteria bacterium]|nr:allantoicase [Acidobacteriota bacterium]
MQFSELVDLASERVGGSVIEANDEFFAPKENLLRPARPVFVEGKYTDRGKWMDGWETRRRRTPGHDWAIIRLGLPGIPRGVVVDTSFFRGNYPEHCSIEARDAAVSGEWKEMLPLSRLQGDSENPFPIDWDERVTHLRFNIFPDGGVARLRVHGHVVPSWPDAGEVDLAAVENGGLVAESSDMFFGSRHNLIMPGRAANMSDGWETRRRRGPGHDWCVIQLGTPGIIHRVEVDTAHFKGNFPESCSLETVDGGILLARTRLEADTRRFLESEIERTGPLARVRFNIFPDGGVSRLRLWGRPQLRIFSEEELLACCGSRSWAKRMAAEQPFRHLEAMAAAADRIWAESSLQDRLEAFAAHPRIGDATAGRWSRQEQSAAAQSPPEVWARLAEANRAYEARFGHIFLVCATGKSAGEILDILERRLANHPETEIRMAAEEQRKITRLRLRKLEGGA